MSEPETLNEALFRDPPMQFRSVPFWSWNDDLDNDELRRQIRAMHAAGQGGFFMHARIGLRTPYLADTWFDRIHTCVDEARRLGMDAWLYDEDQWPSGIAGGIIPAMRIDYRAKALICHVTTKPMVIEEAICRVSGTMSEDRLTDATPWSVGDPFPGGGRVLVQCYPWVAPMGQGGLMQGTTYIDTMNHEAVAAFLDSTHERYVNSLGDEAGRTVPGIFTDEPSFGFCRALPALTKGVWPNAVPWTTNFVTRFEERHGYDVTPHLHLLFLEGEGAEAVRHDYWDTASILFYEAWSKQIFDWCERHNLQLTGHMNFEDGLLEQMKWTGGVMPHFRAFHAPGIDKLRRHTGEVEPNDDFDGSTVGFKQLESVAAQYGKRRVLCEAFGGSGQDLAFRDRWWQTGWILALGGNLLNPHLSLYSLRGKRKRDYPPTLSLHQPWWKYSRAFEDVAARASYALSLGHRRVDFLVIHPMTSAWVEYRPTGKAGVEALDRMIIRLTDGLLALHRDFHFGDEIILADVGDVVGSTLIVGEQAYTTVVVPPLISLKRSTVDLLNRFVANGGTLITIGNGPTMIDGRSQADPVLPSMAIHAPDEVSDGRSVPGDDTWVAFERLVYRIDTTPPVIPRLHGLAKVLDAHVLQTIEVDGTGTDRVWRHLRELPDGREILFLSNTRETTVARFLLTWAGDGSVERLNLSTGDLEPLSFHRLDNHVELDLELPGGGSVLLVKESNRATDVSARIARLVSEMRIDGDWTIANVTPNALPLDYCRYRIGGDDAPWSDSCPVLDAHDAIASIGFGTPFGVCWAFNVEKAIPDLDLIVERDETLALRLNGQPLGPPSGWWLDPTFENWPVGNQLSPGEHVVEITGVFGPETEIEAIYLVGDFVVDAQRVTEHRTTRGQTFAGWKVEPTLRPTPSVSSYRPGDDLAARGYPHLAGEVTLSRSVELDAHWFAQRHRVRLVLSELQAATAVVEVNGESVGQLAWEPYEVDVTHALRPGGNVITVTLVSTLRNLLGPLHKSGGDPILVGPWTFQEIVDGSTESWLAPLGMKDPRLVIEKIAEGAS